MSKHARARSSRPSTSRRVAFAATFCLLTCTAGWVYAVEDEAGGAAAPQARADGRPPAPERAGRAARDADRAGLQGLSGISEQTRAKIPAESRQLVLVTGKAKDSSESTATLYTRPEVGADWVRVASWPARNGAKGWSTERTYGDLTSPQGVFALTDAGGLLPPPPGTRLPYDKNRAFVATGRGVNGESLAGSFDYVVAIDFNRRPGTSPLDPTKPEGERKGGNIWLHVDHDGPSQGCVGIPKEAMKKLLETLDPSAKPIIAMGPSGF
ncbi:L,D-transpeptidase family protein [Streptomyces sp. NPDC088762]|uniref:L,D-transpeptidase family protein n=1 Tax=Streptomyces sp. NPDC088762 TaxID=3365891 RepID=UPI00380032F9